MRNSQSALHAFRSGSAERYFNNRGELNANSRLDFLQTIGNMIKDVASGALTFEDTASNENEVTAEDRDIAAFDAYKAYANGDASEWRDVGAAIATSLQTTMERIGFARTLLKGVPFVLDPARIEIEDASNCVAYISTGYDMLEPVFIADRMVEAPYVEIKNNVRVLQSDVNKGHSGLVEKAYKRAQQAIGVQEDRFYMQNVRAASNPLYGNEVMTLLTGLTPALLSRMRTNIENWAMPATDLITGRDLWPDFVDTAFASAIEPVTQYELVRTGRIGSIVGMNIRTDGLRPKNLQVMDPRELFVAANPEFHGGFGDTGPIRATPRDNFDDGQSAQGWAMSEFVTCVVQARSVQLARRV